MAMIIDATAKYGIRGAIRSLLSPQSTSSDCNERSTPQYVCARKRYESGRKGRICVYRIGDKRTDSGGRKVRLYTNVEGANLGEDERQSFIGIEHTGNYNMSSNRRHKKGRTPPTPDRGIKSKVELQRLDVKPCDLSDDGSDRRSKSDGTAPSQAKGLSSSSNKESIVLRPVDKRRRSRRKPQNDPHGGVGVVDRCQSPNQTLRRHKASRFGDRLLREGPVDNELGAYCSGALPIPQHQLDRLSLEAAPTEPPRRTPKTTIGSTIKLVNDLRSDTSGATKHHQVSGKQTDSVVSEAPRSPFRQPGLTPQESSDLIFGTSFEMASRRKLRAGSMDDRIAPDVHEFASHLVRDHPLGEAEQKKEARSSSHKSNTLNLKHLPSGVSGAQKPQSVAKIALEQVSIDMLGIVHAQTSAPSYRSIPTATPGTPPYTPDKGELDQK